jgi:hypothetical protein
MTSVFQSRVQRTASTAIGATRASKMSLFNNPNSKSQYIQTNSNKKTRPGTTAGPVSIGNDIDLFEDDDEDEVAPGPGAYYNPSN